MHAVHLIARSVGVPSTVEPASVDRHSQKRCDIRFSRVSSLLGDIYLDGITHIHTSPESYKAEAAFPWRRLAGAEQTKRDKHAHIIAANNRRDSFVPFAFNEHGAIGPAGMDLLDAIFQRAANPAQFKTYSMRVLHCVTARHVHAILHGQVRGHAAQTANLTSPTAPLFRPDDVDTQTECANDAVTGAPTAAAPVATPCATEPAAANPDARDDLMDVATDEPDADPATATPPPPAAPSPNGSPPGASILPATLLTGATSGDGGDNEPTHMHVHPPHLTHTTTHYHHPQHLTHTNTYYLPPADWPDGDDDRNDVPDLVGIREGQSASLAGRTADARGGTLEGERATAEDDGPRACGCCTHAAPGHGHGA